VVVVAKFFPAQAGTAAAVAVGKDVAASVAFGCLDDGFVHGSLSYWVKSMQSIQKKRPESGLPGSGLLLPRLNAKARL
jgi:hypothetical protein